MIMINMYFFSLNMIVSNNGFATCILFKLVFFYEWSSYQVFCCGYYFFFILIKHLQSQSPYPHHPAVCPTLLLVHGPPWYPWTSQAHSQPQGLRAMVPSVWNTLPAFVPNCLPPLLQVKAQISLFFFWWAISWSCGEQVCLYMYTHTHNLGTPTSFSSSLVLFFLHYTYHPTNYIINCCFVIICLPSRQECLSVVFINIPAPERLPGIQGVLKLRDEGSNEWISAELWKF